MILLFGAMALGCATFARLKDESKNRRAADAHAWQAEQVRIQLAQLRKEMQMERQAAEEGATQQEALCEGSIPKEGSPKERPIESLSDASSAYEGLSSSCDSCSDSTETDDSWEEGEEEEFTK